MPAKLTRKEVSKRFKELEPNYKVLSEYQGNHKKIRVRHLCGFEYEVTPAHLWDGRQCPKCALTSKQKKLSLRGEERFRRALREHNLEVAKDFVYKNTKQTVEIKCRKCGRVQQSWISNINSGHGCASCNNKLATKTQDFIVRLETKAPEWELRGEYYGATIPTLFYHKKCGREIERVPYVVTNSPNKCKYCHPSQGESEVIDFVISQLPLTRMVLNDRKLLDGKELDVLLPELELAFEYNGLYYHCDSVLARKGYSPNSYHLWKTNECYKKGIRLIHIFEDEWLERPEIVKDKIRACLKLPMSKRYFGRQLSVCQVAKPAAKTFLEANHIQGNGGNSVAYGLYAGEELVAVQAFARRNNGIWELTRYATLLDTQVVGGFTKCLKQFERDYHPKQVYSFADKRWCSLDNNVYVSCGFIKVDETPPSYWYIKGQERCHKFNFRKSLIAKKFPKIYSPNKTEREMMKEAGYERIYDCGLIKYQKDYCYNKNIT